MDVARKRDSMIQKFAHLPSLVKYGARTIYAVDGDTRPSLNAIIRPHTNMPNDTMDHTPARSVSKGDPTEEEDLEIQISSKRPASTPFVHDKNSMTARRMLYTRRSFWP
jgi:hypothetical protein